MLWGMLFPSRQCVWTLMLEVAQRITTPCLQSTFARWLVFDFFMFWLWREPWDLLGPTQYNRRDTLWFLSLFLSILGLLKITAFTPHLDWSLGRWWESWREASTDTQTCEWIRLEESVPVWEHIWRHWSPPLEIASWARPIRLWVNEQQLASSAKFGGELLSNAK